MKALFLGGFAASVVPRILAKVKTPLATEILADERDAARLVPLLADADIVVGHIWRAAFPAAPRMRLPPPSRTPCWSGPVKTIRMTEQPPA
jgi:hypothetical protein